MTFRENLTMASLSQVAGMAIEDLEDFNLPDQLYKGLHILLKLSDYQVDSEGVKGMVIEILNDLMSFYKDKQTEHHDDLKREILGRIREYESELIKRNRSTAPSFGFAGRY